MKKSRLRTPPAGLPRLLLLALAIGSLVHCDGIGPLTGGSSEVGNPNAAIHEPGESEDGDENVTGVEIGFRNGTIRRRRESQAPAPDAFGNPADTASSPVPDLDPATPTER